MTREEAIMVLKNEQPHCGKKALFPEEKKYEAYNRAIKALEQEPKTGHWNLFHTTEHGMREDSYFKCNRCNYESCKEYNFCPKCGARMEVEQNG